MSAYLRPMSPRDRRYLEDLRSWRSGKSREYQKFLILTAARSGSNWLVDLLRHHRKLCIYGEVFNANRLFTVPVLGGYDSPRILAARDLFPARFAQNFIFRGYEPEADAVGFKIMYSDFERLRLGGLWDYLTADPTLRVIRLSRRNLLQALVSEKIARETGHWRDRKSDKTITLMPSECESYFQRALHLKRKYAERLDAHEVLDVYYEDLLAETADVISEILDLLQVPRMDLESSIKKQEHRSMSRAIVNYAELKRYMASTAYAKFFGD